MERADWDGLDVCESAHDRRMLTTEAPEDKEEGKPTITIWFMVYGGGKDGRD